MNINERLLIDTAIGFAFPKKVVIPEPLEKSQGNIFVTAPLEHY